MKVLEDVASLLGEEALAAIKYKYCVYGKSAIAIEGHRGLKRLTVNCVVLSLTAQEDITVNGSNLTVKLITTDYCLVVGDIESTEVKSI